MNIAFTGTRRGMTEHQRDVFTRFLKGGNPYDVLIHGGCVGADDEADQAAATLKLYRIIYPAITNTELRITHATLRGRGPCMFGMPRLPLERNKDIVNEGAFLVACPKENTEILRSGTWATVRYARKIGKRVTVILP